MRNFVLLAAALAVLAACGTKGPLVPPPPKAKTAVLSPGQTDHSSKLAGGMA